jgi:hypothetical protein
MPRGLPNRILGGPDSRANNVTSLAFENCTIGGVDVGTLLRTGDPAFNVTWASVAQITVDGQKVVPPPDGGGSACAKELRAVCGSTSGAGGACFTCCGHQQHLLRRAR